MIRTVIIEDDSFQMSILCDLVKESFPQLTVVGTGALSSEGVSIIRKEKPELVLLDIDLPDQTGFEMLQELSDMHFDVIFVTAHEKYALKAHQFDSMGYLIKPITKTKLDVALKKFSGKSAHPNMGTQFQNLLFSMRNAYDLPQKISVPSLKEIHYVPVKNIMRMEADGNYTTLYLVADQPVLASRQIGDFEERLSGQGFCRVHDKHLINLRYIKSFIKGESGIAVMEDNTQIPVSRRRKEGFLRAIDGMFS